MKEFSTFTIARILNLNRSSLQMYMERGFLSPSVEKANGAGTKSIFSVQDLYKISLFRELSESGLSQKEAGIISSEVNFEDVPDQTRFFVLKRQRSDTGQITKTCEWHKEMPSFEDNWDSILVIDAQKIKDSVDRVLAT